MLEKAANSSRDDTENQDDSQGNCLAAGIEHSPDDLQLIGESLYQKKGSTDGTVLHQPRNKSKEQRKADNLPDSSSGKAKKWAWTPEANELLLKHIEEYKMKCESNGFRFPRLCLHRWP